MKICQTSKSREINNSNNNNNNNNKNDNNNINNNNNNNTNNNKITHKSNSIANENLIKLFTIFQIANDQCDYFFILIKFKLFWTIKKHMD